MCYWPSYLVKKSSIFVLSVYFMKFQGSWLRCTKTWLISFCNTTFGVKSTCLQFRFHIGTRIELASFAILRADLTPYSMSVEGTKLRWLLCPLVRIGVRQRNPTRSGLTPPNFFFTFEWCFFGLLPFMKLSLLVWVCPANIFLFLLKNGQNWVIPFFRFMDHILAIQARHFT